MFRLNLAAYNTCSQSRL